ncbi:MAG: hypothetical protein IIZ59_04140 [Clostridia bacterium]|nr:hypothetical protein [Clostridia bacterium]
MIKINGINYKPAEINEDYKKSDSSLSKLSKKIRSDFSDYINHSKERDGEKRGLLYSGNSVWEGITGSIYDPALDIAVCLRNCFDEENKLYFLTHLIMAAFDIPDELPRFALYDAPLNEENIIHFLYVFKLKQAVIETYQTGFYRRYENFSANDDRVRGVIDVPRHIRMNTEMQNGRIAYNYRERTPDNYINHLIIQTCEHMRKMYPDLFFNTVTTSEDFEAVLSEMKEQCPSWDNANISELLRKSAAPIAHPLYENFEQLRELCVRIWQYEGLAFSGNSNDSISSKSALFYLPDLWESYLEKRVLSRFSHEFTINTQVTLPSKTRPYYKIRPDFIIKKDGKTTAVFDAKFKTWYYEYSITETDEGHAGKAKSDRNQVIDYMISTGCRKGALIFPFRAKSDAVIFAIDNTSRQEMNPANMSFLLYVGLNVPPILENQSFFEWRQTIFAAENELTETLGLFICSKDFTEL